MPPPASILPGFAALIARQTVSLAARDDNPPAEGGSKMIEPSPSKDIHFGQGASPAKNFNNGGFLALFAILAASMTLASIWFFFWAKNGGFQWKKEDWEDYKSTVLRRNKDADGRTISTVTRSRVMRELDEEEAAAEKKAKAAEAGLDSALGTPFDEKSKSPETVYKPWSDVSEYDKEKPARVGGLNKPSEASKFDPSAASLVTSQQSRSSTSRPDKTGGRTSPKTSKDKKGDRTSRTRSLQSSAPSPSESPQRRPRSTRSPPQQNPSRPVSSRPVSSTPAARPVATPVLSPPAPAVTASSPAAAQRSHVNSNMTGSPSRTASSYYAAYRAAAAAHDAARSGVASGAASASSSRPTSPQKGPARSSCPPPANRFLRNQASGPGQNRAHPGAPDDDDERLSHMLPVGEIHPNESASQIGTRAYWAAKRESAKDAGGYRRYSRN